MLSGYNVMLESVVSTGLALLGFLACLVALLAAGCSSTAAPHSGTDEAPDQPNILFVLADDLDLASAQKMPEVSSLLAEEGTTLREWVRGASR
jgi:hypothetical protein